MRITLVPYVSISSSNGYNGGNTLPEFVLVHHYKRFPDGLNNCDALQHTKWWNKKYGKLAANEAEEIPWNKLCVDIVGN